jgi:hypothetical protein
MVGSTKPRAIGFNHVALEVGDIDLAAPAARLLASENDCVADWLAKTKARLA